MLLVSAGIANSMGIDSEPADDGYDNGPWGTYLADDLMAWIAQRYPISSDPDDHHAAGLSMGGFAALHRAFRHPERFGGVGGLSPAVALEIQPERAWMYRDEAHRDANDPQRLAATAPIEDLRVFLGYGATVNHAELGLPLTAFVSLRLIDPLLPDDYAAKLEHFPEVESCWSVAGEDSYILKVRTSTPEQLEQLLFRVRKTAHVTTETTMVLSTYYENRPVGHVEIAHRNRAAEVAAAAAAADPDRG